MKCKFEETEKCIKAALFDKCKDDKRETAFLALRVCPKCPIYKGEVIEKEVKSDKRRV